MPRPLVPHRTRPIFGVVFLAVSALAATVALAVPTVFPVQGYVTDAEGEPLEGDVGAQLTLYNAADGGDAVYSVATTLDVEEGAFTYYLGSDLELETDILRANDGLFLEITIDGETLEPRIEIGSVPYAAVAGQCDVATSVLINDTEVTGVGLQRRIAVPCGPNQAIRSVALDGIPVCIDIATEGSGTGDITEVSAAEGLNGGGTTGAVALSVDFATTQRRISNACPTDEYAVSVSEAGALLCAAPAGDISDVTADTGLSGGGDSGAVTLAVDFAATQRRISNACPTNEFAVSVGEDGTLSCEAPAGDIESVVAGGGLNGGGTDGTVTLSIAEAACPPGQFQTGFNAAGALVCANEAGDGDVTEVVAGGGLSGGGAAGAVTLSLAQAACPPGQFQTGVDVAGTLLCAPEAGDGDVTEVIAGGGLAGGGTTGAVTLSLAEAACPAGLFQTGIDAAGAPTCELEAGTGDITAVNAGEGLSGGGTEDAVALAIDDTVVQRRVGTCVTGQLITEIAADGTVTCVDFPETKVQTKALAADVNADGAVAGISFSNLVVGRMYRLSGQISLDSTAGIGSDDVVLVATHDGATIARFERTLSPGDATTRAGLIATFVATDTTVVIGATGLDATVALVGDGTLARTRMTIEEMGGAIATTDF